MKKITAAIIAAVLILLSGCGIGVKKSVDVPILMYHSVGYDEGNIFVTEPEAFERQMRLIKDAGYTAIGFQELIDYVEKGKALPEKPLIVTFDDGYEDNYTNAYPVLQKLGMKATINAIGVSVGKSTYKDTDIEIRPHFSAEQGREMIESGVIDVQMHSYDLHRAEFDENFRPGTAQLEGESDEDYIRIFTEDTEKCLEAMREDFGIEPYLYAYPGGRYNELSEKVLRELGVKVTLLSADGVNKVERGNPDTLREMLRIDILSTMTDEEFLSAIAREGT